MLSGLFVVHAAAEPFPLSCKRLGEGKINVTLFIKQCHTVNVHFTSINIHCTCKNLAQVALSCIKFVELLQIVVWQSKLCFNIYQKVQASLKNTEVQRSKLCRHNFSLYFFYTSTIICWCIEQVYFFVVYVDTVKINWLNRQYFSYCSLFFPCCLDECQCFCLYVCKCNKGFQGHTIHNQTFTICLPTQDTMSPLPPPPSWLHSLYLKRILKSFSLLFINLESISPPHQCKLQKSENLAKQSNKLTWACVSF